jgi:acetyltransferase-like isoleucine patch superfamily enzyme
MSVKSLARLFLGRIANKIVSLSAEYQTMRAIRKYQIHSSTNVSGVDLTGNVEIGHHTYINPGTRVSGGKVARVIIGNYCAIGRLVHITAYTHSLSVPTPDEDHPDNINDEKDTRIGNYVWIGDKVFVRPGVSIGDYAIIGANSVVIRDVSPFEIVGGVPATPIRLNRDHYRFDKRQ